jgi:hypothetical protein
VAVVVGVVAVVVVVVVRVEEVGEEDCKVEDYDGLGAEKVVARSQVKSRSGGKG